MKYFFVHERYSYSYAGYIWCQFHIELISKEFLSYFLVQAYEQSWDLVENQKANTEEWSSDRVLLPVIRPFLECVNTCSSIFYPFGETGKETDFFISLR